MNQPMKLALPVFAAILAGSPALAQPTPTGPKGASDATAAKASSDPAPSKFVANTQALHCDLGASGPTQTFYLKNAVQQSDANEIVTALRNAESPCTKIFLVSSQGAIVIRASPDDLVLTEKLLADLDRPKKTYRLTYTVSEVDGAKLVGTQHYSMVVVAGQQTQLKQGSKVPIATDSYKPASEAKPGSVQTQFTYLDVGMNFDVTLDDFANGVRLNTTVDQSSVAEQTSIGGVLEPVIRQTSLRSAAFLKPGQELTLGSIDIPGTARHLDIEVTMTNLF
jgi:type II secretory pathway component GspD/PulD (secretin)